MFALSVLSCSCAIAFAAIGGYSFGKNETARENLVFLGLCVCSALWTLGASIGFLVKTTGELWIIYDVLSIAWFLFPGFLFHFFSLFTSTLVPRKRWTYLLCYLPGLVIFIASLSRSLVVKDFARLSETWRIVYNNSSIWYYLNIAYYSSSALLSIALLIRKLRVSSNERQQVVAVLVPLVLAFSLATATGTIAPLVGIASLPPLAPIFLLIFVSGIARAMIKYRFLKPTPEAVTEELLYRVTDMIFWLGLDGKVLRGNETARRLLGYTSIIGMDMSALFHDLPTADLLAKPAKPRMGIETEIFTADGKRIPVRGTAAPIYDYGKLIGYALACEDLRLTRRLAEEIRSRENTARALQKSEEKFAKVFYLSPVSISINDLRTGTFLEINETAVSMIGYSRDQLIGRTIADIRLYNDRKVAVSVARTLVSTGRFLNREIQLVRRDGSIAIGLLSAEAIKLENRRCAIFAFVDMTEKRMLEAEAMKAQKIDSISLLAGGIAHDFNNILTIVIGNLSLAMLGSDNEEVRGQLRDAEKACMRARTLTRQLLIFTKGGEPVMTEVDVVKTITDAVSLSTAGSEACVTVSISPDLGKVRGDETRLSQVFNNLILNAVQAMPDGGYLSIVADSQRIDEAADLPAGDYVRVSVSDTGKGIAPENLGRIFDPYFTTKPMGTGLGLAIAYKVVRDHDGVIRVRSNMETGTTFTVLIPRFKEGE
jgi:PAS domain S-box-containing protein